jgi:predicted small secreted protein
LNFRRLFIFCLLLIVSVLSACGGSNSQGAPTEVLQGPVVPTRITRTPTVTPSATSTPTNTQTPSNTPTNTATVTPSATETYTPSYTPTPTETVTPSPTETFTPSYTPTETYTPSYTPTASETVAPSPTNTPTIEIIRTSLGGNLNFGDTVSDEIADDNYQVEYTFAAQSGDYINIYMEATSGDLDTYLILFDDDGDELARNDDQEPGDSLNAGIQYEVTTDGTYTLHATRFLQEEGTSNGSFVLSLEIGAPAVTRDVNLQYGDIVSGVINDDNFQFEYIFEAQSEDAVNIYMGAISGDLDTYLILLDDEGNQLARNDDQEPGASFNAGIEHTVSRSGTFTILATRFQQETGTSSGEFELSLNSGQALPPRGDGDLRFGDTVSGVINDDNYQFEYVFRAQSGDVVSVYMGAISGDLDTYLILLDDDGDELARNDDQEPGASFNAGIEYTVPRSGIFTILATRFQQETGTSSGEFELSLNNEGQPQPRGDADLRFGDTVSGVINDDNFQSEFTFHAQSGDTVYIYLGAISGDLDTYLILFDDEGNELARNDDQEPGASFNAGIEYIVPRNGMFTILATRFQQETGTSSGEFELSLNIGQPPQPRGDAGLHFGDTVSGVINDDNFQFEYIFQAQPGDVVSIYMGAISGDLDTYLILLDDEGNELARNDDQEPGTSFNAGIEHTFSRSGMFTILATRFQQETGTSSGEFELSLNIGQPPQPRGDAGLHFGDTVSGVINDDNYQFEYIFQAQPGDVVNIYMGAISGDLDTYLILLDDEGNELARNDDQEPGTSFNAGIEHTLSTGGAFTILATRFQQETGASSGEFELSLNDERPPQPRGDDGLHFGETVPGVINDDNFQFEYIFHAQPGDVVSIYMAAISGDLDAYLILLDDNGNELARNDDQEPGTSFNAGIEHTFSRRGTFTILATRFQQETGTSSGEFELSIELLSD